MVNDENRRIRIRIRFRIRIHKSEAWIRESRWIRIRTKMSWIRNTACERGEMRAKPYRVPDRTFPERPYLGHGGLLYK
jgi:hypothetical protein